jgi:hypothetical protein
MASEERSIAGAGDWPDEVRVAGSTPIPPDPMIMEAIGLNYALEAAVADLIDNSIDAGASDVLVRFIKRGPRLESLCIVDNGRGMNEAELAGAMALGMRRDYGPHDLGHFGLGLKAASLGQARSLTVISRASDSAPCGRRWLKENVGDEFACDVVESHFAATLLGRSWGQVEVRTGTLVRWDEVTDFPAAQDAVTTDRYIERTIPRLRNHLGLVFHRLIANETVSITIDVEEPDIEETGAPQGVTPIDPFGYKRSGRPDYPRTLRVHLDPGTAVLECHVWPPRSQVPAFRIPYSNPEHRGQGFYFYRNDRLLQAGGWNGVIEPESRFQLARISVTVDGRLATHLSMNPEKTRIGASETFVQAVEAAGSEDFDLRSYCEDASIRFRESRKPAGTRRPVVPPGRGFAPAVRHAIDSELDFVAGTGPLQILWDEFKVEEFLCKDLFFKIDREQYVVLLNRRYRLAVTGDRGTSLNDAPLLKAVLYLLLNELFQGEYLGAKQKDNVKLWNAILAAAAKVESQ